MLASQREFFDMPRHICYLNAASFSPLPLLTQDAARAAVARKATPWTLDAGFANVQYERTRLAAARLINADAADVALTPSVSYGIATAAKILSIPRGSRVIVLENDHSSPVLEWRARATAQGFTVETVSQPDDGDWTSAVLAIIDRPGAPPVGRAGGDGHPIVRLPAKISARVVAAPIASATCWNVVAARLAPIAPPRRALPAVSRESRATSRPSPSTENPSWNFR